MAGFTFVEQWFLWHTYYKSFSSSSAGDFACSAGELEIGCESWSLQPKAGVSNQKLETWHLCGIWNRITFLSSGVDRLQSGYRRFTCSSQAEVARPLSTGIPTALFIVCSMAPRYGMLSTPARHTWSTLQMSRPMSGEVTQSLMLML